MDILGLIPAAGKAERLGKLPCSKELFPIGFRETPNGSVPKVAGHYLLERFRAAGIRRAFVVLHESKWDVARYFGTGEIADVLLAYLSIPGSRSVPETLSYAAPWVGESIVALGFPDCLFEPADAYSRLLERQAATGADLVLGLFPTERCRTTDMVECGPDGRVRRVEVRPETTALRFNWLIAVWGPAFTRLLVETVRSASDDRAELQIGTVVRAAVEGGLHVEGVELPDGRFRDVGTPDDLAAAVREA
ncbi:MAG TPA: dTDP-glucose pyrophosphorylase [Thermoanaerobaculia bacterium]|jgi:glucose-1-phosphate thymidylyltransferase|nr:dTDP-glucose pyrophosphorylase [Thermoanaerobaculia bacterium]